MAAFGVNPSPNPKKPKILGDSWGSFGTRGRLRRRGSRTAPRRDGAARDHPRPRGDPATERQLQEAAAGEAQARGSGGSGGGRGPTPAPGGSAPVRRRRRRTTVPVAARGGSDVDDDAAAREAVEARAASSGRARIDARRGPRASPATRTRRGGGPDLEKSPDVDDPRADGRTASASARRLSLEAEVREVDALVDALRGMCDGASRIRRRRRAFSDEVNEVDESDDPSGGVEEEPTRRRRRRTTTTTTRRRRG